MKIFSRIVLIIFTYNAIANYVLCRTVRTLCKHIVIPFTVRNVNTANTLFMLGTNNFDICLIRNVRFETDILHV